MHWNVVATVRGGRFDDALAFLQRFGEVERTGYYNVLLVRVDDPDVLMETLREAVENRDPEVEWIGRVVPVTGNFSFRDPEEFESKAAASVRRWLPDLSGRSFHVRVHRRGFKGRLSSQHEEVQLDGELMAATDARGEAGQIDFSDPDYVVALETVGQQAGSSLWSREARRRYPFLGVD